MILFPALWLAGAVVATLCIVIGLDEVLLIQALVTFFYLLTIIRVRRGTHVRRETAKMAILPDPPNQINDAKVPAEICEKSDRFGLGSPDDLHPGLQRKAIQIEQRKLRLQVSTL